MELIDFRLYDPPIAIALEAEEDIWDLHNAFNLDSICLVVTDRKATLAWKLSGYGEPPPDVRGFELVFDDVSYFEVKPHDPEIIDFGEDLCLAGLSRVPPELCTQELGIGCAAVISGDDFHLWFAYRGGQGVRIGARTASFRALGNDT